MSLDDAVTTPGARPLAGPRLLDLRVHRDARGPFVQDDTALSRRGVVRGLHLQHPRAQANPVSVALGEVFDVVVDVRAGSPTFGQWAALTLSSENGGQLYIPPGFAHGCLPRSTP